MDRRELLIGGVLAATGAVLAPAALAQRGAGELPTRRIPSTGEAVPVIGLGTSGTFDASETPADRTRLRQVLAAFLAAGGRVIDTSPMYSGAEQMLGELLTPEMRAQVFLAGKVWTRGEAEGEVQIARSMQLTKRSHIDLMQVHNLRDVTAQLKTLYRLKDAGRIRYVGVTHYTHDSHEELAQLIRHERLDFVQLTYSPLARQAERVVLPLAAERGVAVLVNRPFDDGRLFQHTSAALLPSCAQELNCAGWSQLALKFALSHPAVTCVLAATGNSTHLRENLAAGSGTLPNTRQRTQIAEAVAAARMQRV